MMKKNIGPDLILYLYNLLLAEDKILLCSSIIAQLSFHNSSMSVVYGKPPLSTGYWLARIWYFEKYLNNKNIDINYLSKLTAYLIVSGSYILILNLIFFNLKYVLGTSREIIKIIKNSIKKRNLLRSFCYIPKIIINRFNRNKNKYTPE